MKLKYYLGLLLILFLTTNCKSTKEMKGAFLFHPEHPQPGKEITIKYNPIGTELGEAHEIDAIVYSYNSDISNTEQIYMAKKGGLWTAKFTPSKETYGLLLVFKNGDVIDNNNENGYNIKLYKDNKIVPGSIAGLAVIHKRYARFIGIKGDAELAKLLLEEEFKTNPNIKPEFLETYFLSLPKSTRDSIIKNELETLESSTDFTESNLELLARYFPLIGNIVKGNKYSELIEKKFPKSEFVQLSAYNNLRKEKNINKQIDLLNQFIEKYPNGENAKWMFASIIRGLSKTHKYKQATQLLEQYPKLVNSNIFNLIAWAMYETKTNLKSAVKLAEKGAEVARKEIENNKDKPKVYTDTQWKEQKQMALGMVLDTYANLLKETNQKEKALKIYEETVQVTNEKMPDINTGYTSLLIDLGKKEKAKKLLRKYIDSGKSTDKIKSLYSQVFVELGGSDADLKEYLSKGEKETNKKTLEKLKKEITNKPAPKFSLVDIDGKTISLSDFIGKIVIVDFWATWCGPCLQSFPAMQQAQAKFAESNNVKFLFINTWEQMEDKVKNVNDFLKKTNYPFHILIDDKNEVVSEFGVEGIPTKFIIDKNGNIRFKSVGFSGNANELIAELEQMISMIK